MIEKVQGIVEITGRSLVGLDFSGASLQEWRLNRCRLVDCRFDDAACQGWIVRTCVVQDCSFRGADLRHAHSSEPKGPMTWERVNLGAADLRGMWFSGAEMRECDFSNARFKETDFNQCRLIGCRFAGPVKEALFDGRLLPREPKPYEMAAVDFSMAVFSNVVFRGYTLDDVVLPKDPDVFLVRRFPCVARVALEILPAGESEPVRIVRGVLRNELELVGIRPDASWVFNRRDWLDWGGKELTALAEQTFRRAEPMCSGSATPVGE